METRKITVKNYFPNFQFSLYLLSIILSKQQQNEIRTSRHDDQRCYKQQNQYHGI